MLVKQCVINHAPRTDRWFVAPIVALTNMVKLEMVDPIALIYNITQYIMFGGFTNYKVSSSI